MSVPREPTPAADDLVRSPAWLPLTSSAAGVRLVQLDEAAYRAASFLDQRLLAQPYPQSSCDAALLAAAASRLAPQAHYIFHTGHVGSTLIARLLGAHAGLFVLREPALLRAIAAEPSAAPLPLPPAIALLSRTWHPGQRALIKVTSFVSELAEPILAGPDRPRAIFMCVPPLDYLRTILAGPNSRLESRQLSPSRLQRLIRRLPEPGWHPDLNSEGACIAMSWLCEMTVLTLAAGRAPARILWADFSAFLRAPTPQLQAMFAWLEARTAAGEVEAIVGGGLMQQYSKAPEHAYDAVLRRDLLAAADREHAGEIQRGMSWLHSLGARYRLVAAVLEQAARAGGAT